MHSLTVTRKLADIAIDLTAPDILDYIKSGPTWLTIEDVKASPYLCNQVACRVYAGTNPMSHHANDIRIGGMVGAMQMMSHIATPEAAKYRAGGWLVNARWNRARGEMNAARGALSRAAKTRAFAANFTLPMSQQEHHAPEMRVA